MVGAGQASLRRLEVLVQREGVAAGLVADAGLGVLADALLEEVGLALDGDEVHPVEGVALVEELGHAEAGEEVVRDELDVLDHEVRVDADEGHGEGVRNELLLGVDGGLDDLVDAGHGELLLQHGVEEAGEVPVQALVAGDELVGEAEAGHEAALLEPEDGAEGAGEEDALDGGERDEALGEGGVACKTQ